MDNNTLPESLEKPRARRIRPHLTRLPELTLPRRIYRRFVRAFCKLLTALFIRLEVTGLEHFPRRGPGLIVVNHLGDADLVVGEAVFPVQIDALGKSEIYDFFLLGTILHLFGIIWVHRGLADRRAIREALKGLKEGRLIGIAPEGRESLTGSLEEGLGGAAYLALKAGAPVTPVTFTGTENRRVYGNMKRLRKTGVTVTIGDTFTLKHAGDMHESVRLGTETIMRTLASQLPPEYRGIYTSEDESRQG
jgi:1-acyl-sn-glycerol-3-phosphate acyltransferase